MSDFTYLPTADAGAPAPVAHVATLPGAKVRACIRATALAHLAPVASEWLSVHLEKLALATGLELGEVFAVLNAHTDAPMFCGAGVVATYHPDEAMAIVHRLTVH